MVIDKSEYLKRLHLDLLDIMDAVDLICKNNNIKYYLIGGTLLGAVRHRGFIPWDDDLDIVMPRRDYERFIELCKTELPEKYNLLWITEQNDYHKMFAKVALKGTSYVEQISKSVKSDWGIFIDIFPLDITRGYNYKVKYAKKIVNIIGNALIIKKSKSYTFHILQWVLAKTKSYKSLLLCKERVVKSFGDKGGFYSNFASHYDIKRQTMPKEWFGSGVLLKFENKEYLAPSNCSKVLESIFGKSYMNIPPKEKQITHNPHYIKYYNNDEIYF